MSRHFSPFHRGPDDYDPPPPYVPPTAPSAPSNIHAQNEANEYRESSRQAQGASNTSYSSRGALRQQNSVASAHVPRQNSTTSNATVSSQPPAGPFYPSSPPEGPFYSSNGNSVAAAVPAAAARPQMTGPGPGPCAGVYPALPQQTSTRVRAPPRGPLYNSDTEGVTSYGSTTTGGTTMFNAMPSRVESDSDISSSSDRCCNIL